MRSKEISVWDLFGILNRHRIAFIVVVALVSAATICANAFLKRKYESQAHLLVRLGKENVGMDPALKLTEQATVSVTQSREFEMKTVASMIKERHIVEKVVDEIGPAMVLGSSDGSLDKIKDSIFDNEFMSKAFAPSYQLGERDNAIRKLTKKVKVRMIPETHMVGIYYKNKDPQLAQRIVDAFVRHSLTHHSESYRNPESLSFVSNEKNDAKLKLETAENELILFKKNARLHSVVEQRASLVERISALKSQLMNASSSYNAIEKEIAALQNSLNSLDKFNVASETSGAGNRAIDDMRSELYRLQLREKELAGKYKPTNAALKNIRQQVKEAKALLEQETSRRVEKTYSPSREHQETSILLIQKKSQRDALKEKAESISRQLDSEESALEKLDANALEIKRREREIDLLATNYNRYAREAEHARVDDSLGKSNMSNLTISEHATLNRDPVFPNVPLNLAIGFVLALFLGGLTCVILDTRRSTSPTQEVAAVATSQARAGEAGTNGRLSDERVATDINNEEEPVEGSDESAEIRIPR